LVAEALEMPKATLTTLLGQSTSNVSRLKATRYLPPFVNASAQDGSHGIGPHKDGSFMTYLLGKYNCLEVQNKSGDWIPVPPVPGALVVNIGRLLEIITQGVWVATTHRVVLRTEAFLDDEGKPLGPRFSIPFFQFVNLLLMLEELTVDIPAHIKALGPDKIVASDAETFYSGLFDNCIGDNVFVNHITTFPKVGEKWYPHLLRQAREKQAESKRRISRYGRPIDAASDRRPFLVDQ
jgi:isopenicillin N synthase-like dioxygenase